MDEEFDFHALAEVKAILKFEDPEPFNHEVAMKNLQDSVNARNDAIKLLALNMTKAQENQESLIKSLKDLNSCMKREDENAKRKTFNSSSSNYLMWLFNLKGILPEKVEEKTIMDIWKMNNRQIDEILKHYQIPFKSLHISKKRVLLLSYLGKKF
jgi:hypothetical protein